MNGYPYLHPIDYNPPEFPESFDRREPRQVLLLWRLLEQCYNMKFGIETQRKNRIAAYLAAVHDAKSGDAGDNEKQLAYSIKWRLNQWDDEQRKEWRETVQRAWQHFYNTNEGLRKSIEGHKHGTPKFLTDRLVD